MSFCIIFRFPKELSTTTGDESELRKRIDLAIRNARGIRGNFNTPQMAFESVARQEIALYEIPICESVDLVIELLKGIVRRSTESVSSQYSLLRKSDYGSIYVLGFNFWNRVL